MQKSPSREQDAFIHILPLVILALAFAGFVLTTSTMNLAEDAPSVLAKQDSEEVDDDSDIENDDDSTVSVRSNVTTRSNNSANVENNINIRLNGDDGTAKVQLKNNERTFEEEFELEDNEEIEITSSASGKIKVRRNGDLYEVEATSSAVRTRTHFPLTVDPESNMLIITTPAGEKTVQLPEVAINNMIEKGEFDQVVIEPNEEIEIVEDDNGNLVYEIDVEDNQKVLGLINIKIKKQLRVSAESGDIVATDISLGQRIIDFISF